MDIDQIVERARQDDADLLMDGYAVSDADYPALDDSIAAVGAIAEEFVYDAASWHSDCADIITSMDIDKNDKLRTDLRHALKHLGYLMENPYGKQTQLGTAHLSQMYAMSIGNRIIANALDNHMTYEKLGGE